MAMDAGKFSNFKNVGGPGLPSKKPATSGPKESPSVQQDPTESVQLGAQPVADAKVDQVTSGTSEAKEAPQARVTSFPSSIPSQVGDFLIAGPGMVGGTSAGKKPSFDGLTALNGISSNSIQSVGGFNLASVNPLNPRDAVKPPTTSANLVVNSFEDTSWTTTGGRVISLT